MREWTTPELIVLGRGATEESVLCHCKTKPKGFCTQSRCGKMQGKGNHCYFQQNYTPGNS